MEHLGMILDIYDSYGYTNTLGGLSMFDKKNIGTMEDQFQVFLRSRIPIEQVIKIVNGLTFTNKGMNNWKSGVIRSLKQFIPDGTKAHGAKCENCGGTNVVYEEVVLYARTARFFQVWVKINNLYNE